jgi:hypothetical protein
MALYPKNKFHADLLPVVVHSIEEEAKYTEENGWSDTYIRQAFPQMVYGPGGTTKSVATEALLDDALKNGFTEQAPEMVPPNSVAADLALENARLKAQLEEGDLLEENTRLRALLADRTAKAQADAAASAKRDAPPKPNGKK